jgi:hypothetical protein
MSPIDEKRIIFTAQSKKFFYCRDVICAYVLKQGHVPLNPFRVFGYFLGDRVNRDFVRQGNFNLIRLADELWVFGRDIADGVLAEIKYAHGLGKPIKVFTIGTRVQEIREVPYDHVRFENEIHADNPDRNRVKAILCEHQEPYVKEDNSQRRLFP